MNVKVSLALSNILYDISLNLSVSVKVQNYIFFCTTSPWKREEWDGWSLCRALCRPVTACRGFQRTALPKHRRRLDREKNNDEVLCYTENTLYRKSEINIPRNETARPRSSFYIHVSVSDLYIPRIGLPILLQPNRQTDPENIYCKSLTDTWM